MKGKPLETCLRWMEESAVRKYYDTVYTLHLFMSGDTDAIARAVEGRGGLNDWNSSGDILPTYPDIETDLSADGFGNHGLVNSRINVQGLTMEPELLVAHPEPVMREYVSTFFRNRWSAARWQDHFYAAGMEVEAGGVSFTEIGLEEDKIGIRHSPVLDTVWDRSNRMPNRWGWYAMRDRMTPEKAYAVYHDGVSKAEIDLVCNQEETSEQRRMSDSTGIRLVTEWRYFDRDDHFVILGSAKNRASSILLKLDDDNVYRKTDWNGTAGANPYGVLPVSAWVDSWAPSQFRPVGKAATTIRIAAMLNEVELYMMETLRNGAPLTSVDGTRIDKQLSDDIKSAKSWRALSKIIVTKGGSIKDVISRTDPASLANTVIILRSALKEEMNASTGVQDMMRGQALSGERTKAEIDSLNNHAGIQGQHFRRQFSRHIEDVIRIARPIAAQYDTAPTSLMLPTFGKIETSMYPIREFMEEECPITVSPASLVFQTEDDRKNAAIMEFNQFHLPYIQTGVIDPRKSLQVIGKKYGYEDPQTTLGIDMPKQIASGQTPGDPNATPVPSMSA